MKKFYVVSGYHKVNGWVDATFTTLDEAERYFDNHGSEYAICELKEACEGKGYYYSQSLRIK